MTTAITFASLKGGVGKTTVALNSAYAFARRGPRTLLVDLDPHGAVRMSLDGLCQKPGLACALNSGGPLLSNGVMTLLPEPHPPPS